MFHNGAESQVNVQCIKHPFARTSIWLHHAPSPADFGAVLAGVNIVLLQNLRSSFFNSRKSPRDFLTIVNFLSCQSCSKTHGPGVRWLGHSQNVFFQLWATHTHEGLSSLDNFCNYEPRQFNIRSKSVHWNQNILFDTVNPRKKDPTNIKLCKWFPNTREAVGNIFGGLFCTTAANKIVQPKQLTQVWTT